MNESVEQITLVKSRISRWIIVFVVFSVILLLLELLQASSFYIYIVSGGLNTISSSIWPFFFTACLAGLFSVFLFGISSLIVALIKKPRLKNIGLAVIGISIWFLAEAINVYSSNGFSFGRPRTESVRHYSRNEHCKRGIIWARSAIKKYAEENKGKLPSTKNWGQELLNTTNSQPKWGQRCLERIAINERISGLKIEELPPDIVLLYETQMYKGDESAHEITAMYHYGLGSLVMYGDFHIEFVKKEDFNKLRWEP